MSESPTRGEGSHLSIGEVLAQLQAEFPDVTISKIRFLESQGLVDPERTASGYRKFYDDDVERLRWILRQQREHFLPLKVIKDRLARDSARPGGDVAAPAEEGDPPAPERSASAAGAGHGFGRSAQARPDTLASGVSSATLTREELARASGCDDADLVELERYGLLRARTAGDTTWFDEEALIVARLATSFARHGVEARHLRMYKTAAEREASFFEQVVLPMVKQRNPIARRQSLDTLADLVRLGEGLRGSMLRQALRPYTEGS